MDKTAIIHQQRITPTKEKKYIWRSNVSSHALTTRSEEVNSYYRTFAAYVDCWVELIEIAELLRQFDTSEVCDTANT